MAVNEDYLNFINDQLSGLGGHETKRMFGGIGFFKEGLMFGMIGKNAFRLKADDTNKSDFEAKGMTRFMSDKKNKGMPYYEVPAEIVEDKDELTEWARKSFEAAKRAKNT
ncbi:MAG: TfoX/Sxy family protein [Fulvivirga sp.]